MAYFPKKNEQEEPIAGMNTLGPTAEGIQQGGDQPDQPKTPSSTSSTTSATTPSSAPSTRSSGAKSGSGAPNIGKYIQANKPAAQRLAKGVTEHFSKEATKTGEAVKQQESDFMRRVAQNRAGVQQAQQTATGVAEKAAGLGAGEQLSQEDIQTFRQAQEVKPEVQVLNLSAQESAADRLSKQSEDIRSGLNRGTLLRESFGKRSPYTRGQGKLDELILSGDPSLKAGIIQGTKQQAQDIQSGIADARRASIQQLGGLQQLAQTGQQQVQEGITGNLSDIEQTVSDLQAVRQSELEGLGAEGLSLEDTRSLLGNLGLGDYQYLYGVNPNDYFSEVTPAQVATAEQAARAQALAQLAGTNTDILSSGVESPQIERIKQELAAGKQAYESSLAGERGKMAGLQDFSNAYNHVPNLADRLAIMARTGTWKGQSGARQWASAYNAAQEAQNLANRYGVQDYSNPFEQAVIDSRSRISPGMIGWMQRMGLI